MDISDFPYQQWRDDFPILSREVYGKPLVYLDNAATTQKPSVVVNAMDEVYASYNANIHRGVHRLAQECTEKYEVARAFIAEYLGVPKPKTVVFTSGTTASINLLASSLGESYFQQGDVVLVSEMEHHSNLVSWQLMGKRHGVEVRKIPILEDGTLDFNALEQELNPRVKLVAVAQVSNVFGIVNPIPRIAELVHAHGALLFVDGAQGIKHGGIDLPSMGADFYAFSAHKIYGPTGIGVLWGREELLESLPPWQGGGEMVGTVSFEGTTYAELPYRLEAGTPPYAQAIGLLQALRYYQTVNPQAATDYESLLLHRAHEGLSRIDGISIYGYHSGNAAVLSFTQSGGHHYDMGVLLDKMGIAVRTGTHCAEPLMTRYGLTGTVRASFAFYNTPEEVDRLIEGVGQAVAMLS